MVDDDDVIIKSILRRRDVKDKNDDEVKFNDKLAIVLSIYIFNWLFFLSYTM